MTGEMFRTTRMTILVAVLMVTMMLGVPFKVLDIGGLEPTGHAAAVDVERKFVVGVVDMTISTLNPNKFTMSAESMAIFPCYSTLLQYDEEDQLVGDLAYEWSSSPDLLTWNFKLYDNAYFCDPSEPTVRDPARQVTAEDVIWTFMTIQEEEGSRLHEDWPGVIDAMWSDGPFDVSLRLNQPYVAAMDSFTGCIVLPKYYWEGEQFLSFKNSPPIGSGPFYYATDGLPTEGLVELKRNPIWYAEENMGWRMRVDNFMMKRELDENTAWIELTNHAIDVQLQLPPTIFKNEIPKPDDIIGFNQGSGFVYEFNLNQMTDTLRGELGGAFMSGSNNPLLLNDTVKKAISYCIDKETFINDVWGGYGSSEATTLVPPQNPAHYVYPTPDPFNIAAARQMLIDAGWRYTETGDPIENVPGYLAPLCKVGGTEPLSFRFYTLNTYTWWKVGADLIDYWCEQAGVELNTEYYSVTDMNSIWYSADYDLWLWDWVMPVKAEAASGILVVLTTGAIGTDSDVYWSNATFDDLYRQAIRTMDDKERKLITDEMQRMAYEMRGCQCVAYRDELYGVNTEEWTNFGDWNTNYWLLPDVWPTWLCLRITPYSNPVDNAAPEFYSWGGPASGEVKTSLTGFYAEADDDWLAADDLQYRWFWGDGQRTDWSSSGSASHAYEEDGDYTIYVAVKENAPANGIEDYFMTYKKMHCTVFNSSNDAPVIDSVTYSPLDPDTGTDIVFTCDATDPEGDELFYTWDFGDGHSLMGGSSISHQYMTDGFHEATVYVTDNHFGTGTRPQTATSGLILVGSNSPPSITVNDFGSVNVNRQKTYTCIASDSNSRDYPLKFTWDWGDGSMTVTTDTSASHTYKYKGTYTIAVYCDDNTGLGGHNVSDTGLIYVVNPNNNVPVISDYSVTDANVYTGEEAEFYGVASDADGDGLTFTFRFGDGTSFTQSFGPTAADEPVECYAYKTYSTAGVYTTSLEVSDGSAPDVSPAILMYVEANSAPVIIGLPNRNISTGVEETFTVDAIDLDGDSLTYTWHWDDGTADTVTTVPTAAHTYASAGEYIYSVTVDDGCGHETPELAYAWVNTIPTLQPLSPRTIQVDVGWNYTAVADDADGDPLNYTWEFGDGTVVSGIGISIVSHAYSAVGNYTLNVTVWDGFPLVAHNVTQSTNVEVIADVQVPPVLTPLGDLTATVDELIEFSADVYDPNGDDITCTWDFGDGSPLAIGETVTHAYTTEGTYVFSVSASDGVFTSYSSANATILGDDPPVADAGDDFPVFEDVPATLNGSGSSDDVLVVHWTWTIVEESTVLESDVAVTHYTFLQPGVYTVTLVVTDSIGQVSGPDTVIVTVQDVTNPSSVPEADPAVVDMGGTVELNGSASTDNVGVVAWSWTIELDGVQVAALDGEVVDYVFAEAGIYDVTLRVEDAAGNSDETTIQVTVMDTEAPVAVAVADPLTVNIGGTVSMSGSDSTDNVLVVSWVWTIELGATLVDTIDGESASYTFTALGDYTVTLTVSDAEDNTGSTSLTISVQDLEDPVAAASATPTAVTVGETVSLSSAGSSDNVAIVNWTWTVELAGDIIETLYGETVEFEPAAAGVHNFTLTVADAAGNSASDVVAVTVESGAVNEAPVAAATASPTTVQVGGTVTFSGAGSTDDGVIDSYVWTIELASVLVQTLTGETTSYTFTVVGTYTVTLTVTDDGGLDDSVEITIVVTTAPVAAIMASDTSIEAGDTVDFSGSSSTSSSGIVSYVWTVVLSGQTIATLSGSSVEYTFDDAGTYTVTLNVTDTEGLYDTESITITVAEPADDGKSFVEQYGLALGIVGALVIAGLAGFFLMKKRKGGSGPATSEPPSGDRNA